MLSLFHPFLHFLQFHGLPLLNLLNFPILRGLLRLAPTSELSLDRSRITLPQVMAARYWCHSCSHIVIPLLEDEIKCPLCQTGFIEEITIGSTEEINYRPESNFGSNRALSLWAPILRGMIRNAMSGRVEERNAAELDRVFESIMLRRRNSASRLQMQSENEEEDMNREREPALLINHFNENITIHENIGSIGDYFTNPGSDLLLRILDENDPNRYGTPPAKKEAVEALPTVIIEVKLQCSVCLDDFEMGMEVKELPCKHKFHCGCILPWLELHSSCPVCRYQLPFEERMVDESFRAHIHGGSQ